MQVVNQIGKWNKKELSGPNASRFESMLKNMEVENEGSGAQNVGVDPEKENAQDVRPKELVTHPLMRKSLIIMFVNWIIATMSKYRVS